MQRSTRNLRFAVCLLVVGLAAVSAHADIYTYTFSGTADLSSGDTETIGFIYSTSSPISSFMSVSESQLSSCTNCQSSPIPVLSFLPDSILGDSLVFDDLNGVGSYQFTAGAFSSTGVYSSGGFYDAGTLSVSTSVSVPEPGTLPLGLASGALVGALGMGRRKFSLGVTN